MKVNDAGNPYVLSHIERHSPDGFQWGYGGSGPADLARSILYDLLGDFNIVDRLYQTFKFDFVAKANRVLIIFESDIRAWLEEQDAWKEYEG